MDYLYNLFIHGSLITNTLSSVQRVVIGFLIGSSAGVVVGILFTYSRYLQKIFSPLLKFLSFIPPIAWTPIAIFWFGIGDLPAYFLIFLGTFPVVFSGVYFGVTSCNDTYIKAALCLGANKKVCIREIIIPFALPDILNSLKIGLGIAWFNVIAAEIIGVQSGLGYMIQYNRLLLQLDNVIVGMVMIGLIGLLMNYLITFIEHKLVPWKFIN